MPRRGRSGRRPTSPPAAERQGCSSSTCRRPASGSPPRLRGAQHHDRRGEAGPSSAPWRICRSPQGSFAAAISTYIPGGAMNDSSPKELPAAGLGTVTAFGDVATFMRLPLFRNPADVEMAWSACPGRRHHQPAGRAMGRGRCRPLDHDAPRPSRDRCGALRTGQMRRSRRPVNPPASTHSLERIEKHFANARRRNQPLSTGGDLITLPIMRAIAGAGSRNRPLGMVHFDAHSDTGHLFRGYKYTHGTPFRRCRRGGPARPKHRADRHPRLALQARRQPVGGRPRHARDHHKYFDLGVE